MGMMTRITRLWKADMHGVMDQLEDKALMLKQCLREMEQSLQEKRRRLNRLSRTCDQMRSEITVREKEHHELENDLSLAVKKNKDDIARLLIRKRLVIKAEAERLSGQLKQMEEEQNRLAERVQRQQRQYEEIKVKCAAYCRQVEQHAGGDTDEVWVEAGISGYPSDEEIELELLRFKETTPREGAR